MRALRQFWRANLKIFDIIHKHQDMFQTAMTVTHVVCPAVSQDRLLVHIRGQTKMGLHEEKCLPLQNPSMVPNS